jgi:hypothetical protein
MITKSRVVARELACLNHPATDPPAGRRGAKSSPKGKDLVVLKQPAKILIESLLFGEIFLLRSLRRCFMTNKEQSRRPGGQDINFHDFSSVGDWYEAVRGRVPLQMCQALSHTMKEREMTFPEAYQYLLDISAIIPVPKK